jgi:hypothetical protein
MWCHVLYIAFAASRSRPLRQTGELEPSKKKDLIISRMRRGKSYKALPKEATGI